MDEMHFEQAALLELQEQENGLARVRAAMKPEVANFDGVHCVACATALTEVQKSNKYHRCDDCMYCPDCGEPMPELRLGEGKKRCGICQGILDKEMEQKRKLGR